MLLSAVTPQKSLNAIVKCSAGRGKVRVLASGERKSEWPPGGTRRWTIRRQQFLQPPRMCVNKLAGVHHETVDNSPEASGFTVLPNLLRGDRARRRRASSTLAIDLRVHLASEHALVGVVIRDARHAAPRDLRARFFVNSGLDLVTSGLDPARRESQGQM